MSRVKVVDIDRCSGDDCAGVAEMFVRQKMLESSKRVDQDVTM